MKLDPHTIIALWNGGADTLTIAETLIGTRYEPEAAARAARRIEPEVALIVTRHRDAKHKAEKARAAGLVVQMRRRALARADYGITRTGGGPVTLARVSIQGARP